MSLTQTATDHILDVPFYNQLDSSLDPKWHDKTCGILALKMVMDYYRQQTNQPAIDLAELFESTLGDDGYIANVGWFHPALVRAAARYGFKAWRRSWNIATAGRKQYQDEGVDAPSMASFAAQLKKEALPALVDSIEQGRPMVVSVAKDFSDINKGHLVVLTGFKRGRAAGQYQGFYYNDPYSPTQNDRKDRYVAMARFEAKWNHRAIFLEPQNV